MNERNFEDKFLRPVKRYINKIPTVVSIEVTTRCQLDCVYCTRDKENYNDFDIDRGDQLIEKLQGVNEIIICGIGESFCYPKIYELIWKLKQFNITIITNGAVSIDFEKLNKEGNVKLIIFSIDSPSIDKMKLMCKNYNFDILCNNLMKLKKYPNIIGSVNSTINKENILELKDLIDFSRKYGLQAINFGLPIGDVEFVIENKSIIKKQMKSVIIEAISKGIIINNFYRINCNTKESIIPNIRISGDMYSCCNGLNKGELIGNIYESKIDELWINRAIPLLSNKKTCSECKLVENLKAIVL